MCIVHWWMASVLAAFCVVIPLQYASCLPRLCHSNVPNSRSTLLQLLHMCIVCELNCDSITRSMQGMCGASAAKEHCAWTLYCAQHTPKKKKGGHTNPGVRTIYNNWGEPERSPTLLSSMHSVVYYICDCLVLSLLKPLRRFLVSICLYTWWPLTTLSFEKYDRSPAIDKTLITAQRNKFSLFNAGLD